MDSHLYSDLIHKFQQGTITPAEKLLLDTYWEESLPKDSNRGKALNLEEQKRQQRIYQAVLETIQQTEPGAFRPIRTLWTTSRLAIAASVTGLLLLVFAGWSINQLKVTKPVVYQTNYGQKKRIVLPEGSVVWLNGHSSLRYQTDKAGNRQAWLTGEGFFSVQHTPTHRKFFVHTTNQLTIEVLGTVFNVSDRRGNVQVTLQSGSIRVRDQAHRQPDVLLRPDEMISQTRSHPLMHKQAVRAKPSISWKEGSIYVENKPLGELFDWIEDTYDLKIRSSDSLRAETFAGTIPTDSIDSFFTIISKVYGVPVHKTGKTYQID